jgi:NADH-quinone oxidoreductase subunit E
MSTVEPALNSRIVEEIRAFFPQYPNRQAVVLPALHVVNQHLGYVPPKAVVELADLLELAPADVQDTLSFDGFSRQDEPQGRIRVWACRSLSCAARGGENLVAYLCDKLGIKPGETTPDGRITLDIAECVGACDYAPAMLAGHTLHKNLTKEKIDAFVESVQSSRPPIPTAT